MRRLRCTIRETHRNGNLVTKAFGLAIGYWPCLRAPYIQITVWTRRIEFWYGHPSYKTLPETLICGMPSKVLNGGVCQRNIAHTGPHSYVTWPKRSF